MRVSKTWPSSKRNGERNSSAGTSTSRTTESPLLTYGANSSPERLALKLAHLPEADHEALIRRRRPRGLRRWRRIHHPPLFSSMAATLIPELRDFGQGRRSVPDSGAVHGAVVDRADLSGRRVVGHQAGNRRGGGSDQSRDALRFPVGALSQPGRTPSRVEPPSQPNRRSAALTQTESPRCRSADRVSAKAAGARDLVKAAFEHPAAFMADHFDVFRTAVRALSSPSTGPRCPSTTRRLHERRCTPVLAFRSKGPATPRRPARRSVA